MDFKLPHITLRIVIGMIFLYVSLLIMGLLFIDSIDDKLLDLVFSISSYSLIIYLFKKSIDKSSLKSRFIIGELNFKEEKWKKMIIIRLLLLFMSITFVLTVTYFIQLFDSNFLYEFLMEPVPSDAESFAYKLVRFVVIVILAPIAEELYFRGYLINKFGSQRSLVIAVLSSSSLFSLLHINELFLPQFLGGIFYSLVYIKTRKLILPILLHMLNNFLAGIPQLLPDSELSVVELPDFQVLENTLLIGAVFFIVTFLIISWFFIKELRKIKGETPYKLNARSII